MGLWDKLKAELIERQFWNQCPYGPDDYETVVRKLLPTNKVNPATNEEAVAVYKIVVKDPDERKTGRAFSNAGTEIVIRSEVMLKTGSLLLKESFSGNANWSSASTPGSMPWIVNSTTPPME